MSQPESGSTLNDLFRSVYGPLMKRIGDHGLWDFPPLGMIAWDIKQMPRKPKRWRAILRDMKRCPKIGDETKYHRARRLFGCPDILEDEEW